VPTSDDLSFGILLEVLDDERLELICEACGYVEVVCGLDLARVLAEAHERGCGR
jgi:hypothetical protein